MTYRLDFSVRARADAREGFRWLNERSPAAAARWSRGLIKATDTRRIDPKRHPVAEEASVRFGYEIREMLFKRRRRADRVFFTVEGDLVTVIAIRHSAQGPIEP